MQKLLRFFVLFSLAIPAFAAIREIPVDIVVDKNTLSVRVTANSPKLEALAIQAFRSHGRYKVVASGEDYDFKFSLLGTTQVRVDILPRGSSTPSYSETVSGTDDRNALFRAADIAVVKTNGLGLRGFFTAKLAFIHDLGRSKEVCVSDLFFGGIKQITHDNALALTPRWSPDGTRLLYTSFYKSGFPDIFQIDLNTYQRTTFVSYRGTNTGAHFSPNGTQVAMVLSGEGNSEIYTSSAQGRQVTRRTHSEEAKASPCFSPDGSRIVFSMDPGPQLYIMSAAGGAPQRLGAGFRYAAEPDWSRTKPNLIACTVRSDSYQIAVYDFSKGQAEVVSKAPFDGVEPSWLADGRHLVFTARSASVSRICILDTESGRITIVSPSAFGQASQASVWTP